ncbi:3-deoxy-8-phosphooctulonate synthase [Candidatus Latescibacterota bacterium]
MRKSFDINGIQVGGGAPLFVVAGPCVLESEALADQVCSTIKDITQRLGIGFIFKSSYDKANRQSIESFRGPGIKDGLRMLTGIRDRYNVPVLTDVHSPDEAVEAGNCVDALQIPAFLCRQTDLAVACGRTGKPVFIKKGQFMAPDDMLSTAKKVEYGGSDRIVLVERGTAFGYHNLVVDMRSLREMHELGCPVVYDGTHSVQRPGAGKESSGGDPGLIEPLARAAVACGVDGVFIETHPDCKNALCDAATMFPLDRFEELLNKLITIDSCVKQ